MNPNRFIARLMLVCIILAFISCSPSDPNRKLVGKWKATNGSRVLEFYKDGTVVFNNPGQEPLIAKFLLLDDFHLKIEDRGMTMIKFVTIKDGEIVMRDKEQDKLATRYQRFSGVTPDGVKEKNICINNLRQIDGAKAQWVLEGKKQWDSETPLWSEISIYLKASVKCPEGGVYSINHVGEKPTCSVSGHEL